MANKVTKTDAEWRAVLTPEQYRIMREKGTEPAYSGDHWHVGDQGVYTCAGCGHALFESAAKFDSGSGWPSFFEPVDPDRIETEDDNSHGMRRVEVRCKSCDGHLGHVFEDGPRPTGLRYCINSAALNLKREP